MHRDPEIQQLLDKQACTEVIYRVARAIDRCDAEALAACFHPDATDDHGIFKGTAADFVTFVMPMLAGMIRTQHSICNIIIEVQGNEARAESYFIAQHTLPTDTGAQTEMFAAGRYLDTFSLRNGTWRLQHRHAVYDWNTQEKATSGWDSEPMKTLLQRGARGQDDPSYAHFRSLKDAPR